MVISSNPTLYKLLSLDSQLTSCRRQDLLSQLELCLFSCQVFFLTQEKERRRKKEMKLGKVEFCHFLQLIALFLCFSGMSQAELSRSRSKPYFQSGRSRTKRSWVWNQFFVLEEYMGSDPLYVGKVGTGLSKLQRSVVIVCVWIENCIVLHLGMQSKHYFYERMYGLCSEYYPGQ